MADTDIGGDIRQVCLGSKLTPGAAVALAKTVLESSAAPMGPERLCLDASDISLEAMAELGRMCSSAHYRVEGRASSIRCWPNSIVDWLFDGRLSEATVHFSSGEAYCFISWSADEEEYHYYESCDEPPTSMAGVSVAALNRRIADELAADAGAAKSTEPGRFSAEIDEAGTLSCFVRLGDTKWPRRIKSLAGEVLACFGEPEAVFFEADCRTLEAVVEVRDALGVLPGREVSGSYWSIAGDLKGSLEDESLPGMLDVLSAVQAHVRQVHVLGYRWRWAPNHFSGLIQMRFSKAPVGVVVSGTFYQTYDPGAEEGIAQAKAVASAFLEQLPSVSIATSATMPELPTRMFLESWLLVRDTGNLEMREPLLAEEFGIFEFLSQLKGKEESKEDGRLQWLLRRRYVAMDEFASLDALRNEQPEHELVSDPSSVRRDLEWVRELLQSAPIALMGLDKWGNPTRFLPDIERWIAHCERAASCGDLLTVRCD